MESSDYEETVRNAISLGGDADTLASIAGGIAEAHYGRIPAHIETRVWALLDDRLREILRQFGARFGIAVPAGTRSEE